ncbi:MAG: replicative DNA helicase, partial [Erysipelotrichaceae bacterium]|nr:replicative DNA helicase [Erysipelotrichaceae bacterium]
MTTREIPFSLDAEESLLGNILLFPQSLRECLQEDLQSEDFYLEKNQKIYTVMLNMNERNENIDTISLG